MGQTNSYIFNIPVDPVKLQLPTYFTVIKQPMDLGTIRQKMGDKGYANVKAFAKDVRLVWGNAKKFNPPGHFVYDAAKALEKDFEAKVRMWLCVCRRNEGCLCSVCLCVCLSVCCVVDRVYS